MLVLCPATLLDSFIHSNGFLFEYVVFNMSKIMLSINMNNLTSFFSIQMPAISFSCLIDLTKILSVIYIKRVVKVNFIVLFLTSEETLSTFLFNNIAFLTYSL
jgi:hypothetical protein